MHKSDATLLQCLYEAHETYHVGLRPQTCRLVHEEVLLPLCLNPTTNYRYFVVAHTLEKLRNACNRAERITALDDMLRGSIYRLLFGRFSRTFRMVGGARYFIAAAGYASDELGKMHHSSAYRALAHDMVLVAVLAHILCSDAKRVLEDMHLADQLPALDKRAQTPVELYKSRLVVQKYGSQSLYVTMPQGVRMS